MNKLYAYLTASFLVVLTFTSCGPTDSVRSSAYDQFLEARIYDIISVLAHPTNELSEGSHHWVNDSTLEITIHAVRFLGGTSTTTLRFLYQDDKYTDVSVIADTDNTKAFEAAEKGRFRLLFGGWERSIPSDNISTDIWMDQYSVKQYGGPTHWQPIDTVLLIAMTASHNINFLADRGYTTRALPDRNPKNDYMK